MVEASKAGGDTTGAILIEFDDRRECVRENRRQVMLSADVGMRDAEQSETSSQFSHPVEIAHGP